MGGRGSGYLEMSYKSIYRSILTLMDIFGEYLLLSNLVISVSSFLILKFT